ncbi:MAG: hypothetical protein K6L73_01240 [Cellvibrionaceae bacterium]
MNIEKFFRLFSVFCFALVLINCGGGGGSSTKAASDSGSSEDIIEEVAPKLTWTPPSTRENGDPLSPGEIAGYYLHSINNRTNDEQIIYVEEDGTSSVTLKDFSSGSYEVSIATIDTDGLRSDFSEPVDISI